MCWWAIGVSRNVGSKKLFRQFCTRVQYPIWLHGRVHISVNVLCRLAVKWAVQSAINVTFGYFQFSHFFTNHLCQLLHNLCVSDIACLFSCICHCFRWFRRSSASSNWGSRPVQTSSIAATRRQLSWSKEEVRTAQSYRRDRIIWGGMSLPGYLLGLMINN